MAKEVNGDTFDKEVLQSNKPVLVDFWGPRCGPCLALMPAVEGLSEKYAGKIRIVKVDASQNRRLCLNLKISGLPTMLFYKNGIEVTRLDKRDLTIGEIEKSVNQVIE